MVFRDVYFGGRKKAICALKGVDEKGMNPFNRLYVFIISKWHLYRLEGPVGCVVGEGHLRSRGLNRDQEARGQTTTGSFCGMQSHPCTPGAVGLAL